MRRSDGPSRETSGRQMRGHQMLDRRRAVKQAGRIQGVKLAMVGRVVLKGVKVVPMEWAGPTVVFVLRRVLRRR